MMIFPVFAPVGTVAVTSGSGSQATTTIPVFVRLVHPSAAGSLDQAPVTVDITTATTRDVLVVPVGALLAEGSGGYAVEVAGPGGTRRYVPVTTGIFAVYPVVVVALLIAFGLGMFAACGVGGVAEQFGDLGERQSGNVVVGQRLALFGRQPL